MYHRKELRGFESGIEK